MMFSQDIQYQPLQAQQFQPQAQPYVYHTTAQPQPVQYQNVIYQTHTEHIIDRTTPRNLKVQWVPQRKLYHSGFDSHYPLQLSPFMDLQEYSNLISECTKRFRLVAKPWRSFWKKQKRMMPVEIVAAVATFCLSMFVSIPLWHHGYGKARVCLISNLSDYIN